MLVHTHLGEVPPAGVEQVLPAEQVPVDTQLWHSPSVPQRYAPQTSDGFELQFGSQIPTEPSVDTSRQTYPERHSPDAPGVQEGKQMLWVLLVGMQTPSPIQGSSAADPAGHA